MDGTLELQQLAKIAEAIRKNQQACLTLAGKTLLHAKRIGLLLLAAKEMMPHGGWEEWVEKNFDGTVRSAQQYIRIATHWDEVEAKAKSISHFGIADALKALASPKKAKEEPETAPSVARCLPDAEPATVATVSEPADCPRGGQHEPDEDGDCRKCKEPDVGKAAATVSPTATRTATVTEPKPLGIETTARRIRDVAAELWDKLDGKGRAMFAAVLQDMADQYAAEAGHPCQD